MALRFEGKRRGGETKYEAYEHKKDRIYMKKKKLQGQGFRL